MIDPFLACAVRVDCCNHHFVYVTVGLGHLHWIDCPLVPSLGKLPLVAKKK